MTGALAAPSNAKPSGVRPWATPLYSDAACAGGLVAVGGGAVGAGGTVGGGGGVVAVGGTGVGGGAVVAVAWWRRRHGRWWRGRWLAAQSVAVAARWPRPEPVSAPEEPWPWAAGRSAADAAWWPSAGIGGGGGVARWPPPELELALAEPWARLVAQWAGGAVGGRWRRRRRRLRRRLRHSRGRGQRRGLRFRFIARCEQEQRYQQRQRPQCAPQRRKPSARGHAQSVAPARRFRQEGASSACILAWLVAGLSKELISILSKSL